MSDLHKNLAAACEAVGIEAAERYDRHQDHDDLPPLPELLAKLEGWLLVSTKPRYLNSMVYNDAYLEKVGRPDLFPAKYHAMWAEESPSGEMVVFADGWSSVSQEEADTKAAIEATWKCEEGWGKSTRNAVEDAIDKSKRDEPWEETK